MDKQTNLTITSALASEDYAIAHHFYQLWLDNNIDPNDIDDNWLTTTLEFIERSRKELFFQAFVAKIMVKKNTA